MSIPNIYEGLSVAAATSIQRELQSRIDIRERNMSVKIIAGADVSLNLYSTTVYAGIILLRFPDMVPVASALVQGETHFPYVPGYLAFREVPFLLQAWDMLPQKPDVLVVDGHGIAHPRRMGIATHFGVLTGQPSIGCAKKLLTGIYADPAAEKGSSQFIYHKNEIIGMAYRSKNKTAPVFISPGHLLGMQNTLDIINKCTGRYRIPEPTRLAHELVNRFRKGELPGGYSQL